jgi:two-component system response regulator AtoC
MKRISRSALLGYGLAVTVPLLYFGRRYVDLPAVFDGATSLLLQSGGRKLGELAGQTGWLLTAAVHGAVRLGGGDKMRAVWALVPRVARANATIMLRGESGVGKEVVARAIHAASERGTQPFVKVNCAALPAELLESELFGHEKGAFTGAYRRQAGKFELAHRGTLMLDEIGELPYPLQAKLLHVLQDGEFSPVGAERTIAADVQMIAATNRDLEAAIRAREFREDLYYRLNVIEIHVPPLRERRDEIPALVERFLTRFNDEYGRDVAIPAETLRLFLDYDWPGNVRELENAVKRLVVLGSARSVHDAIVERLRTVRDPTPANGHAAAGHAPAAVSPGEVLALKEIARRAARDAESAIIRETLDRVRWNRARAATLLGISYKSLLNKIAAYGLDR